MIADLMTETFRSLRAHRLRFILTSTGIFWGVALLIFLSANAAGYQADFGDQLTTIGRRIVYLFPGSVSKATSGQRGSRRVEFELEDVDRLPALSTVDRAATNLWVGARIFRANHRSKLIWTYGADANTAPIRNFGLAEGRFISDADVEARAEVVFLGATAARRIFGARPALGRTVHIESVPFRVIGISDAKGDQMVSMGPNDDELALIPVTTAQRWFTRSDSVGVVLIEPTTREISWTAIDHARGLLGTHHGFRHDDKSAVGEFNIQFVMTILEGLLLGLDIFFTAAGIITLLVGAVGVMNIMFVVVTERTREIGLRKAIGASNAAIFMQFLAEALSVTLAAGLAGVVFASLCVWGFRFLIEARSIVASPPILEIQTVLVVFFSLIGIGVASGILPALRAMRVEPAISLRA